MKTIKFNNIDNRVDYLSICETKAISAHGELFNVGDIVKKDDNDGVATIHAFELDKESMDVKAHTDKGWSRIVFITKVKQKNI